MERDVSGTDVGVCGLECLFDALSGIKPWGGHSTVLSHQWRGATGCMQPEYFGGLYNLD